MTASGPRSSPRSAAVPVVLGLVLLLVLSPAAGTLRPADGGPTGAADSLDDARTDRLERLLRDEVRRGPDESPALRDGAVGVGAGSGAGTRIGVIGAGFEAGPPWLRERIADRQRFGPDRPPGAAAEHDTAVAEVAARTAPEADVYVAGVGHTPTPERYARAVEWLVVNDVDVIVDSGSYFPSAAGDARRIVAAAERASAHGVVFVTSAGNYAQRHWAGRTDGDDWVEFAPGTEANSLAGGDPLAGRVSLRLRWNSSADYDLYLYRRQADGLDPVVAKSERRTADDGLSVEAIDAAVPRGRYYVAVHARDGHTEPATIQLFALRRSLAHATPHGSMVAPATGEHVVAVGAVGADGRLRGYSSRGGAGTAVDVAAPGRMRTSVAGNVTGTSAAAPYVAGTAALVESRGGDLRPAEVERILEATADGDRVDPAAAVAAAADANRTAGEDGNADAGDDDRPEREGDDADRSDRRHEDGTNRTAEGDGTRDRGGSSNDGRRSGSREGDGSAGGHSETAGRQYGVAAPGATRAF